MAPQLIVPANSLWLVELITEITRDATLKVMGGKFSPDTIIRMADLFAKATYNYVVSDGRESAPQFEVALSDFASFALMCSIMDEIEKTIPKIGNLNIVCKSVNREELAEFLAGYRDAGKDQ